MVLEKDELPHLMAQGSTAAAEVVHLVLLLAAVVYVAEPQALRFCFLALGQAEP